MQTKKNILIFSAIAAAVFLCGASSQNADAKKAKHNYKTANFFEVSGDQNNPDGTTSRTSGAYDYRYFYRKVAVPGLKMSDPLPLRLSGEYADIYATYPAGSWTGRSNFSITEGYLYINYGYGTKASETDWFYVFPNTGNHKLFTHYGGNSTKKTKRNCAQFFDISVSGDDSNEDAEIVPYSYTPNVPYYYYRKIPVNNLRITSLPDYRVYKKDTYDSDFGESWSSSSFSFFTDGYAWIAYGMKSGATYVDTNEGDFRICFPEKVKKSKNYSKRYVFSVSGDDTNADKEVAYTMTTYYYRKVAVPGIKINDQLNMRLMRKAAFVSGLSEEAWVNGSYYISEDGYIYVPYGYKMTYNNTFYDTATGDYRLFTYK